MDWLDAAIAISSDGSRAFAPILGTGGNDGRLDFTQNFMQRLVDLGLHQTRLAPKAQLWLRHALFGEVGDWHELGNFSLGYNFRWVKIEIGGASGSGKARTQTSSHVGAIEQKMAAKKKFGEVRPLA